MIYSETMPFKCKKCGGKKFRPECRVVLESCTDGVKCMAGETMDIYCERCGWKQGECEPVENG